MKTHLNTLFVTLEGAYLRKDGAAAWFTAALKTDHQTALTGESEA